MRPDRRLHTDHPCPAITQRGFGHRSPYHMQAHTFIPEAQAALKMNYSSPRTLRFKVTATGVYAGKEPLPITFTTGCKGYMYSLEDIEKYLRRTSSK